MIRLGTRASTLALIQANEVAAALRSGGAAVELAPMRTEGDRRDAAPLTLIGGKGLFVREIEDALLASRIDIAVHSLKDLPAELPPGLCLAALPPRADPRDVLVTRGGGGLRDLAPGAVVGTSSPRRRALILAARPDLRVEPARGNVDTRLRKLAGGAYDALILAAAGLHRLGLLPARAERLDADGAVHAARLLADGPMHAEMLDPDDFLPAVGQGTLAVEARAADAPTRAALAALDDPITRACAEAERAFLARMGASCNSPLAAHARVSADGESLRLVALVAREDGGAIIRAEREGPLTIAAAMGRAVAEVLIARGAAEVAPLRPVAGGDR